MNLVSVYILMTAVPDDAYHMKDIETGMLYFVRFVRFSNVKLRHSIEDYN